MTRLARVEEAYVQAAARWAAADWPQDRPGSDDDVIPDGRTPCAVCAAAVHAAHVAAVQAATALAAAREGDWAAACAAAAQSRSVELWLWDACVWGPFAGVVDAAAAAAADAAVAP